MNKKLTKWLSLMLACGMIFSATACGTGDDSSAGGGIEIDKSVPTGGDPDAEQTLDIYLLYKGYGDLWLKSAINRFAKQEWVKEKYPNFSINYTFNSMDSHPHQKLTAGASINKYDLMFGVNMQGYESRGVIADLTDSVYLADVPGEEGTKVIDKIPDYALRLVRNATADPRADGNDTYMVVSYIKAFYSFMYNADILRTLNLEVPLTTDHFLEVAEAISTTGYTWASGKTGYNVITNRAPADYWRDTYDLWWSQYEGAEGVNNYYEGYDPLEEQTNSNVVLQQEGRLESLKVIESILTKYSYSNRDEANYRVVQTAFLMGDGVFHVNGDYFASEMQTEIDTLKKQGISYDIQYMKAPVISAIIKKTPTIKTDAELRAVIKEIDADVTYTDSQAKKNGVSQADFETIVEARSFGGLSRASAQSAIVPSYAAGKGIAADFLRFMYTEESIKDFTVSSGGIIFPTTYDIANDAEVFAKIQPIHQSKLKIMQGTSNYPFTYSVSAGGTRLGKGGLTSLYYKGKFEVNFTLPEGSRQSAADILKEEADYWNKNTWDQMVASAGA